MRNRPFLNKILPELLTIGSFLFLVVRSFQYASILPARIDESLFLYKGYLFTSGVYTPFEDYGLWTNKNPLSFLIPGWFQQLFGAGLRSGRYLSILLGLLTVIAIWIITKKFTTSWISTLSVAAVCFNPFYAWTFAQFISQSLAAALLAWMLVFSLGKNKPTWQIVIGTIFAVLLVQVRQNLIPVLPLLILYIYWEDGKKAGTISLLSGVITFSALTAIYLPDIIRNYLAVIPAFLIPFVQELIYQPDANLVVSHSVPLVERVHSFTQGLRTHLIEIMGMSLCSINFIKRTRKKNDHFKRNVFLAVTFVILFLAHLWASIFKNYCVYCFSNYLAFFGIIGSILFAVSVYDNKGKENSSIQNISGCILILLLCVSAGFSIYQDTGHLLMEIQILRIKDLTIETGTVELWTMLSNKFGYSYDQLEIIIPTIFGLLFGLLVLGLAALIKKHSKKAFSFLNTGFILLAFLGSPLTFLMSEEQYGTPTQTCSQDIITTYEEIGAYLNSQIASDSKVWVWAISGQVILSYIDDIHIYPPQLNYMFNYLEGGSSDELYKHGYWNEELALEWLAEADYAIIENSTFNGDVVKWINPEQFDELAHTVPINACDPSNYFRIFRRK